ncbi:MAG: carboxypeptidase regulatory-like domain-containing protein [Nitrospirae bacterium]|nr:carboxypeptidase regulatory-like domain-containing protein [Nitrospirota bacterium]MBI3352415.1 carboxypeptidase regulatory-like domain-containing protein [Nitrospirota bacterium]
MKGVSKTFRVHRVLIIVMGAILPLVMTLSNITHAEEYQEINVAEGGTITGRAVLKGPIPPPRVFHLALYPFGPFCKKVDSDGKGNRLLDEFKVGKNGGFQNVVIMVTGVKEGKPFPQPKGEIETVDCVFSPFVSVVKNHQKVKVTNKDPIFHNLQVYQSEKGKIILNSPLNINTTESGVLNFEPGKKISQWICGMHEFMQNWAFVIDNPYYAISGEEGRFSIESLPPGKYTVIAWHPHMKIVSREITVKANAMTSVNFEFQGGEVERPEYEKQEKGRIQHRAGKDDITQ